LCGKQHNVGFISTRFAGTDGVSLETAKWANVFEKVGFTCFYFAGEIDCPPEHSYLVEEAHFTHPDIKDIFRNCFGASVRGRFVTRKIYEMKQKLKDHLYQFIDKYKLDLLVPAHHHDFFWERQHFMINACWEYLNMAFPPHLPSIRHVVINSSADNQLSLRTGISATIIPNVMDFDNPPPVSGNFESCALDSGENHRSDDDYALDVRQGLGVADDELLILQPTRVVKRKGIEHAIELVHRLGMKAKFVISHASGDNGRKVYTLEDIYPHADLVTYPSNFEGFGNAFLEAVYFCCPIVVNTYSIYTIDIKPKGFSVIEIDGYVTDEAVRKTKKVLTDPELRRKMVTHNYETAKKYYSYSILAKKLKNLIADCTGCQKLKNMD
jgi:glycosyltransferase involved in cell wall biosynthesis